MQYTWQDRNAYVQYTVNEFIRRLRDVPDDFAMGSVDEITRELQITIRGVIGDVVEEHQSRKEAPVGSMIPDIAMRDGDDRRTVIAALFKYVEYMTVAVYATGEIDHVANEYAIVARLVKALRDQEAAAAANDALTDGNILSFLLRIQDKHGKDPEEGPDCG